MDDIQFYIHFFISTLLFNWVIKDISEHFNQLNTFQYALSSFIWNSIDKDGILVYSIDIENKEYQFL